MDNLHRKIKQLQKQKNVLILAHYYTLPEVQEVADLVGDSLALARKAADTDADIILFAGVHFMAETAKILNPDKKVLIPDLSAGCSLANCCKEKSLKDFIAAHPGYKVFSYINCSATVKALSDMIVTSGNALRIVGAQREDEKIIFVPDRNLGDYINRRTGRNMLLWDGFCTVHDRYTADAVMQAVKQHPGALVIAHPECRREILEKADFTGSTAAMLRFVEDSNHTDFIVVTESGILHALRKYNPAKHFYTIFEDPAPHDCLDMKKNNLENIYNTLLTESPELQMDAGLMAKALIPIRRMLES